MLAEELAQLPLFRNLRAEQLDQLAGLFRRVEVAAGQAVFYEGDEARDLYVLESGELTIQFCPYDGECLNIATVQPGDAFGWSAALGRARYSSSALCRQDVRALAIRGVDLRQVMRTDPELGELMLERLAKVVASRFEGLRAQMVAFMQTHTGQPVR